MHRSVSGVSIGGGNQYGAYKSDKTINNGYIPNQKYILNANKQKVISERKQQGVKLGDCNVSRTGIDIYKLNELKNLNSKFKRNAKELKKKVTNDSDKGDDNDEPEYNGDQFREKQYRKKYKTN